MIYGAGIVTQRGAYRVTLDATGNAVSKVDDLADPQGASNHGIAVDKAGKVWSPQVTLDYTSGNDYGTVNRWNSNATFDQRFNVDPGNTLYTYSDMTGIQLRTITTRDGHWYQVFDSAYNKPVWDHLEFTSTTPAGTSVTIEVRAGDSVASFSNGTATAWCGRSAPARRRWRPVRSSTTTATRRSTCGCRRPWTSSARPSPT